MTDDRPIVVAYLTLVDGTLVDLEMRDGFLIVRAGQSLKPADRPQVLTLSWSDLVDINRAAVDLFMHDFPRLPKDAR